MRLVFDLMLDYIHNTFTRFYIIIHEYRLLSLPTSLRVWRYRGRINIRSCICRLPSQFVYISFPVGLDLGSSKQF